MRISLEYPPVLGYLAHRECAADDLAGLVLAELKAALFVYLGGVVFSSLAVQSYRALVLPAVLGGLTPDLSHAVMELTADFLGLAPAFGSFPLFTSGDF